MAGQRSSSRGELLRALYFNRTGLLLLFMIIISIGMIALSARTTGGTSQFLVALATSILATTLYSALHVFLTTQQFEQLLEGSIQRAVVDQLSTVSTRMLQDYQAIQRQFIPITQYSASDEPDPVFNRDINRSVQASTHYTFRGMTGQHAVARLGLLPRPPSDVKLIIAHPSTPAAVDSRAQLLLERRDVADIQQARERIVEGILSALAGVHIIHARFDRIEICLTSDPHIDRVEIFDDEIYLTLFSGETGQPNTFPSSMKFTRDSLIYQMYSRDCDRLLARHFPELIRTHRGITALRYLELLSAAGLPMDQQILAEKGEEFRAFQQQVRNQLVPP